MKRFLKKGMAALLSVVMVVTAAPQLAKEVHAAELPDSTKFATVDELKTFNTNDNDGEKNPAKVYFGNNDQQWWIAGSQDGNLTLFAASPLAINQMFESTWENDKINQDLWKDCTYLNESPIEVGPNHYGASPLRNTLKDLEISYFTSAEQNLMNETTIYTDDLKNSSVYSTTNKLYLAYGYEDKSIWDEYITVGENSSKDLNNGLRIDNNYWGKDDLWLRAPHLSDPHRYARIAQPKPTMYNKIIVYYRFVNSQIALVPAFELNLLSVLFASAASAASSDGALTTNDAFTLRYSGKDLGSVLVSYDKRKVILTGVPNGTYLVVQNSDGAKAKHITNEKEVSASDMGLDTFVNCKVWLETTNTTNRMTYATLATEEKETIVNITAGTGLSIASNNAKQEVAPNTAITDITVEVADGYYLPDDYISKLQSLSWNGLNVTKTDTGFTIKGTPTRDVKIELPAARKEHFVVEGGVKGTDYTYRNGILTFNTNGEYVVKHPEGVKETGDRIVIPGKFKGMLMLDNITINLNDVPCIDVAGSADLTIMIRGTNVLGVHSHDAAAIQFMNVTDSGRLVIDSEEPEGELKLHGRNGPGIGSPGYNSAYTKNIYINGGIIDVSSDNGIGIGSYSDKYPSEITINGGTITGSKIGSNVPQSNVIVNGGNISNELIGETVIDGGFVQGKVNDTEIKNPAGDTVYKANITLENSNVKFLKVDGKDYPFPAQPGTSNVCVYLPVGEHKLTHEDFDGKIYEFTIIIGEDGTVKYVNGWTKELSIEGWIYGETENDPSATAKYGDVVYTYSSEENGEYTTEVPRNAGTYYVKATVAGTTNYTGLESDPVQFEITKAELSVKVKVKDKPYDGLNTAEIETVTLVGVAEGDQIKLINGTPTFSRIDAGENIAIHFTEFTLEAEEDVLNNYTLIQPTGVTANITNTWIPTKDVEYTTSQPNANGWLKEDFKIQAKEGYLLALGNKADGSRSVNWNKELAGSEEGANSIVFYVKNVKTGAISIGITENYQLDKTKPQVNGLEKDKVYCKEITFTVEETNLDVVKVNEKDLTPNEKGVYTLTAGNHRITVVDQAGNETVLAVTVNAEHTPNADDSDCTTPVTCAVCGTVVKEAQEHSFTTYTSDSNAGCLTDGTKTAECDHEGCVQTKTVAEEGSALGHDWGEWETVTSPDCENKGSEKRTCKRCSVTETKDLEASGHAWEEEFTVDQEATCTEEGSKSIHCKKCDAVKDSTSIPATGHAYGKPKWNWNGDGKTVAVTFICQNDSSHVETKTAEVTSAVNKPATCTQAGITTYTATVSFEGNVYTDTKDVADMEALGHDWEEKYTVDKEATCTEEGSKSIHCKNCDEMKDNMVLPATGHKYVHGVCAICEANNPNYKEHEIADGNGSSWNKGDENGLSVQTPGVIGKITDVILSGKPLVEGADYVVNDGTVILKPNVLKELKEGNHTLTIYGEKGYVETQIKIEQNATLVPQNPGNTAKPEKPDDKDPNQETGSPKTGDYANLALWFGLLFASIGSASVTYFYKKKKRN